MGGQAGPCQGHALSVHGGIDAHAGLVENRSARQIHIPDAGRDQPFRPILAVIHMQQSMMH